MIYVGFMKLKQNLLSFFQLESKPKEPKLKTPKPIDCSNCKFFCSFNFPENIRAEICRSFWQLGDYRRQKDFILSNVTSSSPKRRRPGRESTEKSKIRTNSKSFYFQSKRVCQSFFLKTLAISNGPLIKAFEHKNIYTNFFDGDDKRGKHTPSNKLSEETVNSVLEHFEAYIVRNTKCRKRTISDPEIRSLRHLYSMFTESHDESHHLSYTSFKRIFHEHNFAFPPDRVRSKAVKSDQKNETKTDEIIECISSHEYIEEQVIEDNMPVANFAMQPNLIVTQVPETSKFFTNPQVYEIQFVEIPISTST